MSPPPAPAASGSPLVASECSASAGPQSGVPGAPAGVGRTALQAAGSVAGMMITTEAMVTDQPKDEPAAPAMPDMGGMGGMGGMM